MFMLLFTERRLHVGSRSPCSSQMVRINFGSAWCKEYNDWSWKIWYIKFSSGKSRVLLRTHWLALSDSAPECGWETEDDWHERLESWQNFNVSEEVSRAYHLVTLLIIFYFFPQVLCAIICIDCNIISSNCALLLLERVPLDFVLDVFRLPLLHNIEHCIFRE